MAAAGILLSELSTIVRVGLGPPCTRFASFAWTSARGRSKLGRYPSRPDENLCLAPAGAPSGAAAVTCAASASRPAVVRSETVGLPSPTKLDWRELWREP